MRTFHIFDVNSSIVNLTRNDSYPLFYSFLKIKNLGSADLSIGVNLYEQIATPIDKNKFFARLVSSLINFETAFEYEKTAITESREEVGFNILYNPIPSVLRYLVTINLKIKPTNLPNIPPIKSIIVDLKNVLSFDILNYMLFFNKYMI